jgi:hypothetical protein
MSENKLYVAFDGPKWEICIIYITDHNLCYESKKAGLEINFSKI